MTKIKLVLVGVSLGIMLSICGCGSSTGNQKLAKLDTSQMSQILVKGQTTTSEVLAKFGEPNDVDFDNKGNKKWIYSHTKSNLKGTAYIPYVNLISSGTNDTTKKLVMQFDKNDRLAEYVVTSSKGETKMGLIH